LDLFTVDRILGEPALLEGIVAYPQDGAVHKIPGSELYLRVLAKTAYVSSQKSRMENPELVDVDISTLSPRPILSCFGSANEE